MRSDRPTAGKLTPSAPPVPSAMPTPRPRPPGPSRRRFLAAAAALAAGPIFARTAAAHPNHGAVVPDPRSRVPDPVPLATIEPVRLGGTTLVRATAADGRVGAVVANPKLPDVRSLFDRLARPAFEGRDARDVVQIVEHVRAAGRNYKYAGMPFWNAVAHGELATWDLLGRAAGVSCTDLLGRRRRRRLKVYVSRFDRDTTPEREVDAAAEVLARTGASAVKLKVGRRMGTTRDQNRRDVAMVALARERLGDGVELFLDANGSYTAAEAVRMGTRFAEHRVGFLEEPCDWQDEAATLAAQRGLAEAGVRLDLAGGEQDSSLAAFRRFAAARLFSPVQPDLFYCGGAVRLLTVARIADAASLPVTPHAPRTGPAAFADTVVRATIPNLGPYQEFRDSPEIVGGTIPVPDGPGWGLPWSDDEIREAEPA